MSKQLSAVVKLLKKKKKVKKLRFGVPGVMEKPNVIVSYLHNTWIRMKLDLTFLKEDVL